MFLNGFKYSKLWNLAFQKRNILMSIKKNITSLMLLLLYVLLCPSSGILHFDPNFKIERASWLLHRKWSNKHNPAN